MISRFLLLATLCVVLSTGTAYAVPAKRTPFTVQLIDGTYVTVMMTGDETYHFLVTTDGTPVVKEEGQQLYRLAPEMKETVFTNWSTASAKRNAHRFERAANVKASNKVRKAAGLSAAYTGQKRGIVILVNFADKAMKEENNQQAFNDQFNKEGYSLDNHVGSVHDYFYASSYGQFDLQFDIFGPVTVSHNAAYYGGNDFSGSDMYPATMVAEACRLADATYDITWSTYDWDSDGEVDQVFLVYAGGGEHVTGVSDQIWAHEQNLDNAKSIGDGDGAISFGNETVNTYAVSCELSGNDDSCINGIGTACHEFTHCLGIPDLYDTSYKGGYGMNAWDLMDGGSYNGPAKHGEVPSGYTAYERWMSGWMEPVELKKACTIKGMPALQDEALAYIIYNDNNRDEYFLLENRQNRGWFKYVDDASSIHGLLVTHVDYDETSWKNNKVNSSATHQRMSIVPAGKDYGEYVSSAGRYYPSNQVLASQIFPGIKNVTRLTNESHYDANAKLFNKNTDGTYYMNKPITDIAENDGLITFAFMGGVDENTPIATAATYVGNGSFTANWETVDGASSYSLELRAVEKASPAEALVLGEDMHKCVGTSSGADGYDDISASLDDYMENAGWTGSKIYSCPASLKMGTSKIASTLTSPTITAPSSEALTLTFDAKYYRTDASTMCVTLLSATGSELQKESVTLTDSVEQYVLVFDNVTTDVKIRFSTSGGAQRVYFYSINVYDDYFTASDFDTTASAKARNATEDKKIIEGITTTSYRLTGLTASTYRYRVLAVVNGIKSEWSEYITVNDVTKNADPAEGIEGILSDDNEAVAEYYTIDGTKASTPVTPGIYLVKRGNMVKKIFIQ